MKQKQIKPIKPIFNKKEDKENFQEKKKLTAREILDSDMLGALKGKGDAFNSIKYAKKLADDMFK